MDELGRILRAADETEGTVCGLPAGRFWPALVLTCYYTGFRIGAVMQLRAADFDPQTRTIDVPAAMQKHRAEQVLRLPRDGADAIAAMGPLTDRERLFPWPYDGKGTTHFLLKHFKRILARADVPLRRGEGFHKLRKTSASYLAKATDERTAQDHLGHSALSVTALYLDPRIVRRQHTSELMERPEWRIVSNETEGAA